LESLRLQVESPVLGMSIHIHLVYLVGWEPSNVVLLHANGLKTPRQVCLESCPLASVTVCGSFYVGDTVFIHILNRFCWVFCQLEVLRDCLPPSVRRTLDELPESLDETYERILKEIKRPNRDHARRLLSCLVAAVRPLQVKELSEVLAVDYEDEEGIQRLNPNWRWEVEIGRGNPGVTKLPPVPLPAETRDPPQG
jgi:hypothetical protein